MRIKETRCKDIIGEIDGIVSNFADYAEKAGIKDKTVNYIDSVIKAQKMK